jgi:hypothetical protein
VCGVLAMCVCVCVRSYICPLRCGPYFPFYSFQGEGSGYIRGKKMKWGKMKEKNKKGGLGCGRLPPYLVGIVSL